MTICTGLLGVDENVLKWMTTRLSAIMISGDSDGPLRSFRVCYFLQDMLVPVRDLPESLDVFDKVFRVYPLWLCPMRIPRNPKYELYVRSYLVCTAIRQSSDLPAT